MYAFCQHFCLDLKNPKGIGKGQRKHNEEGCFDVLKSVKLVENIAYCQDDEGGIDDFQDRREHCFDHGKV